MDKKEFKDQAFRLAHAGWAEGVFPLVGGLFTHSTVFSDQF